MVPYDMAYVAHDMAVQHKHHPPKSPSATDCLQGHWRDKSSLQKLEQKQQHFTPPRRHCRGVYSRTRIALQTATSVFKQNSTRLMALIFCSLRNLWWVCIDCDLENNCIAYRNAKQVMHPCCISKTSVLLLLRVMLTAQPPD